MILLKSMVANVLSIFKYEIVWHSFTTPFQVIVRHAKLALWLVAIEALKTYGFVIDLFR
jgi:hypothetical protein